MSVQQVTANLSSLVGDQSDEDLAGTVEWRQGFWGQVLGDLLGSRAWLTGLGFGEILPARYEVDVGFTNSEDEHHSHCAASTTRISPCWPVPGFPASRCGCCSG